MTLQHYAIMPKAARLRWLDSDEHKHNCAAFSEGQACCLEKLEESKEDNEEDKRRET